MGPKLSILKKINTKDFSKTLVHRCQIAVALLQFYCKTEL